MTLKNTSLAYGGITKFFHWLIFLLIFGMIIYGYFLDYIPKPYRHTTTNIHKLIGVTILFLMLLRILWGLINIRVRLPFDVPLWQRMAERSVHLLLYALIIAMP